MEFAERPVSELVVRLVKIVKLLLYDTTSGDFLLQRSDPLFHESSTHGVHRVWFSRTKVRSVVPRRFAVSRQPKSLDGAERAHRPARRALSRRSASMLVSHGDARVAEHAPTLMRQLLSGRVADEARAAALGAELATYFADAFGNATRIDYGTGHELSFFAWLLGLEEAGLLEAADRPAVVARVLGRYLLLMREVQTTYWLEPAGSHGVWGLDDYHWLSSENERC